MIPVLTTDRLTLRGATRGDFTAFAAMLATDRTQYMGGPFDSAAAWACFTDTIASWHLNGFGGWIITDRTTGAFLGDVGILHPHRYPEPELGWTLTGDAEGHGYAVEAAATALRWYWCETKADTLVSYITPGNARSEALARKLGATPDATAPLPTGETRDETIVFRHAASSLIQENPPRRADRQDAPPPNDCENGAIAAAMASRASASAGSGGAA